MVMSQSASPVLGGVAPLTVMTGLPAMKPIDKVVLDREPPAIVASMKEIWNKQREELELLQESLERMHHSTAESVKKNQERKRTARMEKPGVFMAQFSVDDFVLYADVCAETRSKPRSK